MPLDGLERTRRTVNDRSRNGIDMALARDSHMDRIGRLVNKPMQFSRRLMA